MLRAAAFMASRPFSDRTLREEAAAALAALEVWGLECEALADWAPPVPLAGLFPVEWPLVPLAGLLPVEWAPVPGLPLW